jgi:hypothetical protein
MANGPVVGAAHKRSEVGAETFKGLPSSLTVPTAVVRVLEKYH